MPKFFNTGQSAAVRSSQLPPYKYEALGIGEIRLLNLSEQSTKRQLIADIITICLEGSEKQNVPEYSALSYTWNETRSSSTNQAGTHTVRLRIDEKNFNIKPNLAKALRQLSESKTKLLWVDAICINQEDVDERNSQVRMMKSIYQKAQLVLIWLGDGPRPGTYFPEGGFGIMTISKTIGRFADLQRRDESNVNLIKILDNPLGKKEKITEWSFGYGNQVLGVKEWDPKGGNWPALLEFFDTDWWRRVWVRQELTVAQEAIVLYGNQRVSWKDVSAVCHWLASCVSDLDERSVKYLGQGLMHGHCGAYSGEDLEYFRQTLRMRGKLDFEAMLIHARDCATTDPRDRVFAMLGLVDNEKDKIPINYTHSISKVACQAFKKIVNEDNRLGTLIFSQNPGQEEHIPSWAPNICSTFITKPSRLTNQDASLYNAGQTATSPFEIFDKSDKPILSVQGLVFDHIERVSNTSNFHGRENIIRAWRPLVFSWFGPSVDINLKYDRLMRTLTGDRDIRGRRLPSGRNVVEWKRYFRIEHLDVGAKKEFEYLALAIRGVSSDGAAISDNELNSWIRLYEETIKAKRLVLTTSGRLGLAPFHAQQGDAICIIPGVDVPFILSKRKNNRYVLVGESYIHGAMDGEILSEGIETETILLE